jgi:hypothetical protein
VSYGKR